jgi:DNA-binding response OmpR family regulator
MTDGSPPGDDPAPTVLAVDDEPDLVELYRVYLQDEYDVRLATGGEEALSRMDDDVDVVLLDRRMSDLTGHEVLAEMRAAGYDARVAMVTAVEPDVDVVDMPFDDYQTKPVSREDVRALVAVLLRRAEFDEQSQRFFALASKKAALEASGLTGTDEYERVLTQIADTRAEVDTTLDRLSATDAFTELSMNAP